jgi:hypothetical protein
MGNGDVIIRFKKLDKKFNTHNIPTQQSMEFNNQIRLFEPSPSVNLNAGYQLVGLDVKAYITYPVDTKNNSWIWELTFVPAKPVLEMPPKKTPAPERKVSQRGEKESGVNEEGKSETNQP